MCQRGGKLRCCPASGGASALPYAPCAGLPNSGHAGASAFVFLLPYLEQKALWEMFDPNDYPWNAITTTWQTAGQNAAAIAVRPKVLVCPSDTSKPTVASKTR